MATEMTKHQADVVAGALVDSVGQRLSPQEAEMASNEVVKALRDVGYRIVDGSLLDELYSVADQLRSS